MTSDSKIQITPKDASSGWIDNSEQVTTKFWEKMPSSGWKKEINVEKALEIIKKSRENIFIYTPRIAAGDLLLELENKQNQGVRIYLLVNDLDLHYQQKLFEKFGIARGRTDISSTFIIIDPKENCNGLWFEGNLSSKNDSSSIILELTREQAYGAYCHFTHLWWRSEGDEIKENKKIRTKKLCTKVPDFPSLIDTSFRIEALDNLVSGKISEMGISENFPEKASVFLDEADKVCLVVNEKCRELFDDINTETVSGYHSFPFSFISTDSRDIAFSGDIGFILEQDQKSTINEFISKSDWSYYTRKKIGDITGMILPFESDWDSGNKISIEPEKSIQLGDINTVNLDEWQKGDCRPKYPDGTNYSRKIEYKWRILPPVLPKDAKNHILYTQWNEFDNRLKKACRELLSDINNYELSLEGRKKVTKANTISKWKETVNSILNMEHGTGSTAINRSGESLKTLREIRDEIIQESDDLRNGSEEIKENNEYAESSKKKENNISKRVNPEDIPIPKFALPTVGTLYRSGNDDYLAIKFQDEIDAAKEEVRNYTNCRLVTEKTW